MTKNKRNKLSDIAGWYGAVAIIAAFFLVSFGYISSNGITYQLLNLTGAIGIIDIALAKHVKQSVVINIFWGAISIFAIIKIILLHN
jgi:hypothetical protein